MGKISTSIVKSSFSKQNIAEYKLSILCGVDSLYYCISTKTQEVLVLKKFDLFNSSSINEIFVNSSVHEEIWDADSILSLYFPEIHIAFIHPHFTIIPNRLFREADKATYLSPLKKTADIFEICFDNDLPSINAKLIFDLPKSAVDFFRSKYGNRAIYYNAFTALINGYSKEMEQYSGKHVWLNVHPNLVQIILFDGNELIFSNQFPFQSDKDFLYYVLLVYNQFKLDPNNIPLHASGQLVKESAIYKSLYRYIRNISFLTISDTHQLNSELSENPTYFFFDLLSF